MQEVQGGFERLDTPGNPIQQDKRGSRRNSAVERKIVKTEKEWKEQLTKEQYQVTRLKQDDGKGDWVDEKASGVYLCICCDEPLFDSCKKFKASDGRPAFFSHLGMVVHIEGLEEKREAICNRCGAHLGLYSEDGPEPTRHHFSVNPLALKFIFADEEVMVDQTDRPFDVQSPAPPTDKKLEEKVKQQFNEVTHSLDTPKKQRMPHGLVINPDAPAVADIRTMFQSPAPVHRTANEPRSFAFSLGDTPAIEEAPFHLDDLKSPERRLHFA